MIHTPRKRYFQQSPSGAIHEYGPLTINLVNSIQLPDGSSYSFSYETTPGPPGTCTPNQGTQPSCVTGRISQVTLPKGGTIAYAYTYTNGFNGIEADGTTAGFTRTVSPGGFGSSGQWTYSRAAGSSSNLWTTTTTDAGGNQTSINFSEDTNTGSPTYYFYETQRQVYQGSISGSSCSATNPNNCLLATTITCYNANYANCATASVSSPITQKDFYRQLLNGSAALSEVVYDSSGLGLVQDAKEYDYGAITGAAPGNTKLIKETVITYAALGNGIVNKPATIVVKDWTTGAATTLSSSTYSYDQGTLTTPAASTPQHISITGSRGNLTTLKTSTNGTASLSKTFSYYDTGMLNVATDVNGATTTYVYGTAAQGATTISCGNSFPTTINGPTGMGLSRSMVWNCTGGVSTTVTDENTNSVTSSYTDSDFWRPANVSDQMSSQTNLTYNSPTAVEAALQNFNGGASASDSLSTVDGLGRPVFSQRLQAPGGTSYDTFETDYNGLGQPYRTTMPYTTTASPSSSNTTVAATVRTYDALGRVLTIADADGGTVSYTYTNNDVLQTVSGTPSGTQSFQKQFEYDGLGRLTSVCEVTSVLSGAGTCAQGTTQTGYWTKYTYDAVGHLQTARRMLKRQRQTGRLVHSRTIG